MRRGFRGLCGVIAVQGPRNCSGCDGARWRNAGVRHITALNGERDVVRNAVFICALLINNPPSVRPGATSRASKRIQQGPSRSALRRSHQYAGRGKRQTASALPEMNMTPKHRPYRQHPTVRQETVVTRRSGYETATRAADRRWQPGHTAHATGTSS